MRQTCRMAGASASPEARITEPIIPENDARVTCRAHGQETVPQRRRRTAVSHKHGFVYLSVGSFGNGTLASVSTFLKADCGDFITRKLLSALSPAYTVADKHSKQMTRS